jgi:hypothetical protein
MSFCIPVFKPNSYHWRRKSVKWFRRINLDSLWAGKEPHAHHLSIGQYVQ